MVCCGKNRLLSLLSFLFITWPQVFGISFDYSLITETKRTSSNFSSLSPNILLLIDKTLWLDSEYLTSSRNSLPMNSRISQDPEICRYLSQISSFSHKFYLFIDETTNPSVVISPCPEKSQNFFGLISINPEILSEVTQNKLEEVFVEIFQNLYPEGFVLNLGLLELSEDFQLHSARRRLDIQETFDLEANETSVPIAINVFVSDPNATSEFYWYMLTALCQYNLTEFQSSNDFLIYASAIESLMQSPFRNLTSMTVLEQLSQYLYSENQDYLEFPDSIQSVLDIQSLYFDYITTNFEQTSDIFQDSALEVNKILNDFVVNVTQGSALTLENTLEFQTSSFLALNSSISIKYIKTNGSNIEGCVCEFCVDSMILGKFDVFYSGLFDNGAAFSVQLYMAGNIDLDEYNNPVNVTFTSEQALFSVNNCFNTSHIISTYQSTPVLGYECLSLSENSLPNNCSIQIINNETMQLNAYGQGIFFIQSSCSEGCLNCSKDPSLCEKCSEGYFLTDQSTCTLCDNTCKSCQNTSSSCSSCKLNANLFDTNKSCICIQQFGFNASNGDCINCSDSMCAHCESDFGVCMDCFGGYFLYENSCNACNFTCETCNDSSLCLACAPGLEGPFEGICRCSQGQGLVDFTANCEACDDPSCKECFSDYQICDVCEDGYFLQGTTCLKCDPSCLTCSNSSSCESCRENSNFTVNGMCECINPYGFNSEYTCTLCIDLNCQECSYNNSLCDLCIEGFFSNEGICEKCNFQCETCMNAEKCSSCPFNSTGPDVLGNCPCDFKYGRDQVSGSCYVCEDLNCQNCSENYLVCDECFSGFYFDSFCKDCNETCQTCTDMFSCETCKNHSSIQEEFCVCDNGFGRDLDLSCSPCIANCVECPLNFSECNLCETGYFINETQCSVCNFTCKECSNENQCDMCWENATLNANNECVCNINFGRDVNTGKCQLCDQNCNSCTDNFQECSDCKDGYGLDLISSSCQKCLENCETCHEDSSKCAKCVSGFFFDGQICSPCNDTCQECSDFFTCTVCWDHASLIANQCICDNGLGLNENGTCSACLQKCEQCTSNFSKCSNCSEPYGLDVLTFECSGCKDLNCENCHSDMNICDQCTENYFVEAGLCSACNDTCRTCNSKDSCTSCWRNASLDSSGLCVCDYGLGFDAFGTCQECGLHCEVCSHNYLQCDSCLAPFGLDLQSFTCQSCTHGCLDCSLNASSCQVCSDGYFLSNNQCQECSNTCLTCEKFDLCSSCKANASINPSDNACVCNTGFGFNLTNGECQNCLENCADCSENFLLCQNCSENYGLNLEFLVCESCQENCINCHNDSSKCLLCADGYFINAEGQCQVCEAKCRTCDINGCNICWENATLNGSDCVCNDGFGFDSEFQCQECNSFCNACTSNYLQCTDCKSPYGLNHSDYTCQNCSEHCLACHDNAEKCELCENGFYINQGLCASCYGICETCSSFDVCETCSANSYGPDSDGHCYCNSRYGQSASNNCTECNDDLCLDCADNSAFCDVCVNNSQKINGACTCNNYYGYNQNSCSICKDPLCLDCSSDYSSCKTCVPNTQSMLPCTCLNNSSYNAVSKQCECNLGYILSNTSQCLAGKRYITSSDFSAAFFDTSFSYILVSFNTNLDVSVAADCSKIFNSVSALGLRPVCSFPSTNSIKVILGLGWDLNAQSVVSLNSSYLLTTSGHFYLEFSPVTFSPQYSVEPTPPTAAISGPLSFATTCYTSTLVYRGDKSSGIASESFTYTWSTTIPGGPSSTLDTLSIASQTLAGLSTFTVTLTVTDIFLNANSTYLIISVTDQRSLTVSLDSGTSISMKSSSALNILASVTDFCGLSGVPVYKWSWVPFEANSLITVPSSGKLSIASKALAASAVPYIFTASAILSGLQGNASVTITVTASPLVLQLNRPTGDVTSSLGFVADASTSYDPDNSRTVLSYSWVLVPSSLVTSGVSTNSATLSIPGNNFQRLSSFTLNVTISADFRSTTKTVTYNVVDDVNTVIKMIVPPKSSVSKQFLMTTTITSTAGSTIKWSQLLGPNAAIVPSNYPYLSFSSFALQPGQTYSFQIAVTQSNGNFLRSYATFNTNIGGACTGSLLLSNNNPVYLSNIYMSISNCKDLDAQDYPLSYTFGYSVSSKSTALGLASGNNYLNFILPIGTYTLYVKVLDTLGDGNTYNSTTITIRKSRYLKETQDIENEYQEYSKMYGVINSQLFLLNSFELNQQEIQFIWQDFTQFVTSETMSEEVIESICNIVLNYLNPLQSATINFNSIEQYMNFVMQRLSQLPSISQSTANSVIEVMNQVLQISNSDEYINLVENNMDQVFKLINLSGSLPILIGMDNIVVYFVSDQNNAIPKTSVLIGKNLVTVNQLLVGQNLIVSEQFAVYSSKKASDMISISITSSKAFTNYQIINTYTQDISLINGVDIQLALYQPGSFLCEYLSLDFSTSSCLIMSQNETSVTIRAFHNGIYYLVPNQANASLAPMLIISSLLVFGLLQLLLTHLTQKSSEKSHKLEATIGESISEKPFRNSSISLDTQLESAKTVEDSAQLKQSQVLSDHKIKTIVRVVGVLMLEVFIENLMLKNRDLLERIGEIGIGGLSVTVVFPLNILCYLLFAKDSFTCNSLAYLFLISAQFVSFAGSVLIDFTGMWPVPLLSGLFFEFFVAEMLIYLTKKLIFH